MSAWVGASSVVGVKFGSRFGIVNVLNAVELNPVAWSLSPGASEVWLGYKPWSVLECRVVL